MIVLHITTIEFNDNGKRNWILFEVEAENMQEVVKRLNEGELVFGYALRVRKDEHDSSVRVVHSVSETTIHRDEVHRVATPLWRLVRYEDAATDQVSGA